MSFAEVVLRIGLTLVGWLVAFVHLLILGILPRTSCAQGAGDVLAGSLMMAVPAAICLAVIGAGKRVSPMMRYASVPAALVWPFAVVAVWPTLGAGDTHLCVALGLASDAGAAPGWHAWWPWVQLGLLAAIAARFVELLRAGRDAARVRA